MPSKFDERLRKAAHAMRTTGEAMMAQMKYSHRNGETEPPTIEGWYWFESNVAPLRTGVLRVYIEDNEPMVNVTFIKDGYSKHMSAALEDGQWWGPIVPPWGAS